MLRIEDLHFSISGSNILNGITLSIKEGETVGIIGPNGSGKTTLFNCISGFAIPDSGLIEFNGVDITRRAPAERAQLGLGRVFQNFGIFREMSLEENVVVALEARQPLRKTFFPWQAQHQKNKDRALEHLAEVGLESKVHDKASSLSGGQMRLLEIVRTLAFGAEIFLLDEPTAGVAPKLKGDLGKVVSKLGGESGTVVIIEHDINFIQSFCDRIIVLDSGSVMLDGTPEEIVASEELKEIYFGKTFDQNSDQPSA